MSFRVCTASLFFLLLPFASTYSQPPGKCRISLKGLSHERAKPGSVITLHGSWGEEQGEKIAVINRGGRNDLEVLHWSKHFITAKIPGSLSSGDYKVGVYCRDLVKGSTYSSGFKTLIIDAPSSLHMPVLPPKKPSKSSSKTVKQAANTPSPRDNKKHGLDLKNIWDKYWWVFLLLGGVFFVSPRRSDVIKMPPHADQSRKPQKSTRSPNDSDRAGTVAGTPYWVYSYDDETVCVEIEAPANMTYKAQVDARSGQVGDIDKSIKSLAQKLLNLGVNYIDVNYSTDKIAAEIPSDILQGDQEIIKAIASRLVMIAKLTP